MVASASMLQISASFSMKQAWISKGRFTDPFLTKRPTRANIGSSFCAMQLRLGELCVSCNSFHHVAAVMLSRSRQILLVRAATAARTWPEQHTLSPNRPKRLRLGNE
jgi:hypothetical protein